MVLVMPRAPELSKEDLQTMLQVCMEDCVEREESLRDGSKYIYPRDAAVVISILLAQPEYYRTQIPEQVWHDLSTLFHLYQDIKQDTPPHQLSLFFFTLIITLINAYDGSGTRL